MVFAALGVAARHEAVLDGFELPVAVGEIVEDEGIFGELFRREAVDAVRPRHGGERQDAAVDAHAGDKIGEHAAHDQGSGEVGAGELPLVRSAQRVGLVVLMHAEGLVACIAPLAADECKRAGRVALAGREALGAAGLRHGERAGDAGAEAQFADGLAELDAAHEIAAGRIENDLDAAAGRDAARGHEGAQRLGRLGRD
jgi:hypothetical protein